MKVYYIEDDIFLHQQFIKYSGEIYSEGISSIEIPKIDQLEKFYYDIPNLEISSADMFIIDISLNIYYSGIDFAQRIRENQPKCSIVFLTSDTSKGIDIINANIHPDRYLVKEDMRQVIREIVECIIETRYVPLDDKRIIYHSKNNTYIFDPNDINYFTKVSGSRNTIELYKNSEVLTFPGSLKELKPLFHDCSFFSEFKSFLINPQNIKSINKSTGEVIFKNQDSITFSLRNINRLNKFLKTKII